MGDLINKRRRLSPRGMLAESCAKQKKVQGEFRLLNLAYIT